MIAEIVLSLVIVALLVDRYLFTKEMTKRLTQAMEMASSKHMGDYLAAKKTEEAPVNEPSSQPEDVDISEASEKDFMSAIK